MGGGGIKDCEMINKLGEVKISGRWRQNIKEKRQK